MYVYIYIYIDSSLVAQISGYLVAGAFAAGMLLLLLLLLVAAASCWGAKLLKTLPCCS